MNRYLRGFSVLGVIGTFIILLQGALVTKTGSGEGCGNTWPFCHGEVMPSYHTVELWIEYSHRIVSALVGLIVVILSAWAWKTYRDHKTIKFLAFNSIFFIVLQGALGASTVISKHTDAVLALHFGFSLLSFASVALLAVFLFQLGKTGDLGFDWQTIPQRFRYGLYGLAVYTYVVVYTGAFVRHAGASLGCKQWPFCGTSWLTDLTGQAGIHMIHRLFAGLLFVLTIWLWWVVRRHYSERKDLNRGATFALVMVVLQVITGGLIIWSNLQLMIALLHTTLIAAYFSALCYLCFQVGLPWKWSKNETSISG